MHDTIFPYHYRLFGLLLASELELPELRRADHDLPADIVIRFGRDGKAHGFPLVVDDVATFTISKGSSIVIDPVVGVPERNIRLFLLGSAMGILLHQRELLPLHANGVVIDGQAVAFTGPSGAGKSTLAAWFHDRGFAILADDVCVIDAQEGGVPLALPGLTRIRMWKDALEASGRNVADFERSVMRNDEEAIDKFDVVLSEAAVHDCAVKLGAVVELLPGMTVSHERLSGEQSIAVLIENTYRGHLIGDVGSPSSHFHSAVNIVRSVPILRLKRPFDPSQFNHTAEAILEILRQELGASCA